MYTEIRTCRPTIGAVPDSLDVVGETGIAIETYHLGHLVGSCFSETGPINEIVPIRAFSSLDDRQACRAALMAESEWRALLPAFRDPVEVADIGMLRPAAARPRRLTF
ncbi:NIPSNAP family protein [Ensifer soli]|uniref:NIPSNAP family protein n=1 Tax=Ciceribacter sp. sgz301302 TaxID=3342379 RepID=UPI0035BB43CB